MRGSAARGGGGGGGWEGAGNAASPHGCSTRGWWRHRGGGCRDPAPLAPPNPHPCTFLRLGASSLPLSPARERSCSSIAPAAGGCQGPLRPPFVALPGRAVPMGRDKAGAPSGTQEPALQRGCLGGDGPPARAGECPGSLRVCPPAESSLAAPEDAPGHCQWAPDAGAGVGAGCRFAIVGHGRA